MSRAHVVAKVLLVDSHNRVLVLRRSDTDQRRPLEGDIPGGWVDPGEDFKAAAARETQEEAGITIGADDLELVYTFSKMLDGRSTCWLFFIAQTDTTDFVLSDEHDHGEWVSLNVAIQRITYKVQNDFLVYARDNGLLS